MLRARKRVRTSEKRLKETRVDGDPALASYLRDISDSTPLSAGEERELARSFRDGDGGPVTRW